jgi:hypothetical protein
LRVVSCGLRGRNGIFFLSDDGIFLLRSDGFRSRCGARALWFSDDDNFRSVEIVVVLGVQVVVFAKRHGGVGFRGEFLLGSRDGELADCFFVGGEVGGGGLEVLDQERGSLEVDVVAGEAGGGVGQGFLDGGAVVEVEDLEGVVLEDGGNVVGAVLEAHHLVVHGDGAAADALLL